MTIGGLFPPSTGSLDLRLGEFPGSFFLNGVLILNRVVSGQCVLSLISLHYFKKMVGNSVAFIPFRLI